MVLALEGFELSLQVGVRPGELSEPHERAHDGDVHAYGPLAPQHARQHRDALRGEYVREILAVSPATPF